MALYWRGTGTNWSDSTAWSTTDGGGSAGVIPTAADDVNFTANGNGTNCTLDTPTAKVAKTLTINGYTGTLTFNVQLSVSGSITFTTTGFSFAGTTTNKLRMIAAGTWTTNGKTIPQDVEIGGTTTFTCTLADALTTTGTLTLTNTTSTIFSGAFNLTGANITISGSQTLTLTGHLITTGLTTISDANVINTSTSKEVQTASLTTSGASTGTAGYRITGSGTLTLTAAVSNNIAVDGDTVLSGTCLFAASGTPTLTLGNNVDLTGGTLSIASACTIVGGTSSTINAVTITAALTLTLNTNAVTFATLTTPNAAVTFAGNVGFIAGTWLNTTIASAARTYTLTQGNTYRVTTAMNLNGASSALTLTLVSSHATNKVVVTLDYGASQDIYQLNATRLDSSNGQTIATLGGTVTTCLNWATSITGATVRPLGDGSLAISGVTYDKDGAILGSCRVYLFRDNGDATCCYQGVTTSNASTGAYTFSTLTPGNSYFVVAFKAGATPVMDVTGRALVAA